MHWLDIIILIVLGIGAAMGFGSGLLWQIARVVSLAVSLYVAVVVNADAADWIGQQWKDADPAFDRIAAFIAVFLLVYLVLYVMTRFLHNAIKATKLETLDRVLGALLGAAKMAAIVACVCAVMVALALPVFADWFDHSMLARHFAKGTEVVVGWIPQTYRDRADEGFTQVRGQLQQKITDAAVDTLKGDTAKK
jgi:membrane protein required for colicin V production